MKMRVQFPSLVALLIILSTSMSWGLTMDDLVQREGLWYKKFTDVPFTGEIDEGLEKGNYDNGKREGPWVIYHKNGQLRHKVNYKNGKREGTWVFYKADGTKRIFKDESFFGGIFFDEGSGVYREGKKVSG